MCEALRELFADDLRESREEGIMEGRNVGKREGEASKVIEIVIKKYKKGCSVKETADMLEEPQTLIKQIYDVIGQCAPDYNVEAIYKNFIESYSKNKNSKLYQALADAVMRANWEKLKEGSNMCEALKELFADDLRESREQGIIEGRIEGRNAGRIEGRIEGRCDITCNSYSCA